MVSYQRKKPKPAGPAGLKCLLVLCCKKSCYDSHRYMYFSCALLKTVNC